MTCFWIRMLNRIFQLSIDFVPERCSIFDKLCDSLIISHGAIHQVFDNHVLKFCSQFQQESTKSTKKSNTDCLNPNLEPLLINVTCASAVCIRSASPTASTVYWAFIKIHTCVHEKCLTSLSSRLCIWPISVDRAAGSSNLYWT